MKITTMILMAIALAAQGQAGTDRAQTQGPDLQVCVRVSGVFKGFDLARSRDIGGKIMATAGVSIHWVECEWDSVRLTNDVIIDLAPDRPPDDHPGALAYAFFHEGVHIVVMTNRVQRGRDARFFSVLLGHVMSHELAHVLEGISRHSKEGIMKARWTAKDCEVMAWRPMRFAPEDVALIQIGLEKRFATRPAPTAESTEGR
jgi:hypothetical protein